MCGELKRRVQVWKPSNLLELEEYDAEDEWAKIHQNRCTKLEQNYTKRLQAVVNKNGQTIDYWAMGP